MVDSQPFWQEQYEKLSKTGVKIIMPKNRHKIGKKENRL
jgi:hypothetical protein